MDLLECPDCAARYMVGNAGVGDGWLCQQCRSELGLLARGLRPTPPRFETRLRSDHLIPIGQAESEGLLREQPRSNRSGLDRA